MYDLQVRYDPEKEFDIGMYVQLETLTEVEGLRVGLSLTGFSVGVLEGCEMNNRKEQCVR